MAEKGDTRHDVPRYNNANQPEFRAQLALPLSLARVTSSHPKKLVVLREFKDSVFLKKRVADSR